ncbi:MAG: site-2 protease family protein [Spirochaetales bacterium]|nr:site-2 protease family protein [Spirochaetales bacterium]
MDQDRIIQIAIQLIAFYIAGSVHEFFHALAAYKQGDNTAKSMGRLTLNPLAHIDPFGSVLFPVIGVFTGLPVIGWMRPVPTNPNNYADPSKGGAVTAAAGPFANLLQASLAIVLLKVGFFLYLAVGGVIGKYILFFFSSYLSINLALMVFNLLPVPPLDGGWILRHAIPESQRRYFDNIYRYGFIILYALVFFNIIDIIFVPVNILVSFIKGIYLTTPLIVLALPFLGLMALLAFFFRVELKLVAERFGHGARMGQSGGKGSALDSLASENRSLAEVGARLINKIHRGEEFDLSDEKLIVALKRKARGKEIGPCSNNGFDRDALNCRHCSSYPLCLVNEIEDSRTSHR